jgi:tousled-like kinase
VKYPIFRERYQLVGLLGKGGFSEVYKAFDLDKFNYKAVKMHRLQANWDAFSKMNYIRHATREFNVG